MTDPEREETVSLYALLSRHEEELDTVLRNLKTRLERELYAFMSIAELEDIISGTKASEEN